MITSRSKTSAPRAAFCHVTLPRAEQRHAAGESRPHTVYLVRLESHLGKYPSADTWFELRYSRFHALHATLRETHATLRLPWLPRASLLGSQHPSYVQQMAEALLRYLRQLLACWQRAYGGFEGFIELLHALHHVWPLPPPPEAATSSMLGSDVVQREPQSAASSTSEGGGANLPQIDGEALGAALNWREYVEHVERLLELGTGAGESTPFEEEGAIEESTVHVWRVERFSVRRVPCERDEPLRLHTTDAYILLVPITPDADEPKSDANEPRSDKPRSGWRAHYWIGASCTADKSGAAAALVVQLGGLLHSDGKLVGGHMREVEGDESTTLLTALPKIEAIAGGSGSGWRARMRPALPARLLRISAGGTVGRGGCLGHVVRVAPQVSSLGDTHAYILDSPKEDAPLNPASTAEPGGGTVDESAVSSGPHTGAIFQWHGHSASLRSKATALLLAHNEKRLSPRSQSFSKCGEICSC